MEPDDEIVIDIIGKLIKLRFFVCKNLQTLFAKLGHGNFLKTNAS